MVKRGTVAQPFGLPAQDARAGGVEGRDPHRGRHRADQVDHPALHLGRGLVGEGDGEDLVGTGLAALDQVRDAVGQHPRLARAGARQDEQRAAFVVDGRRLPLVQQRSPGVVA